MIEHLREWWQAYAAVGALAGAAALVLLFLVSAIGSHFSGPDDEVHP